ARLDRRGAVDADGDRVRSGRNGADAGAGPQLGARGAAALREGAVRHTALPRGRRRGGPGPNSARSTITARAFSASTETELPSAATNVADSAAPRIECCGRSNSSKAPSASTPV